ncbi:TonB-dependent receptor [Sphingobium lignivorans]|uniref:Outer membrane receptor protein involved in Fe transport n=1 Tax=Sphingobium lignivorans TaxID=2735886 RepID=A0ABR6NI07_9SPHN|nr:TonB-dependent receptor [Sphingobium lignivorans]MBB5986736.1 outer membrane receptor protein involved in Fe transport [Sphingobium lignivorans]
MAAFATGVCIMAMAVPAQAQDRQFNIAAGNLKTVLDAFSRQAGTPIIYQGGEMQGLRSKGYRGKASPQEALEALLRGTGFGMRVDTSGALAVARLGNGQGNEAGQPGGTPEATSDLFGNGSGDPVAGEIVVTGTRVVRDGYDAPTPTTVIGSTLIDSKAPTTIIDALITLPVFKNSSTAQTAGVGQAGSSGQSFANLRGLGANRTLVLLDGQRFVPSTSIGTVDIGVIPSALIQRVDVVTGGASAAYGSDAVAGVVNFVLDNRFTGLKGAAEIGISTYGDNRTVRASLSGGFRFAERGHVLLSGEYVRANGVPINARPDTEYPIARLITNPAWTPTNGQFRRLIVPYNYTRTATLGGVIVGGPLAGLEFGSGGTTFQQPVGTYVGTSNHVLPGRFDGEAWDLSVSLSALPQEKATGYGRISWDVTDGLTAYATGVIARNKPGPFFSSPANTLITGNFVIQRDNAYLPQSVKTLMETLGLQTISVGRYSEDFGASQVSRTNDTFRAVIGLQGNIGGSWYLDVYGEYGENKQKLLIENNSIRANLALASDAVDEGLILTGVASGKIVCRSTITNPNNGCIPLNIFGPTATRFAPVSPAAAAYVFGTSRADLTVTQKVVAASLSGEPFSTWAGPVSVVAGGEYREESARQTSDSLSQANAFGLGNPKPLSGNLNMKEVFAETVVPLAKDVPFLRSLDLNGAIRVTDYSTSGSITTWKVGANWEPVDGIRFRATRSRDIRAPNIVELFTSPVLSTAGVIDPVTNTSPTFQTYSLGNPNLRPERADTTAAGVVVRPPFFRGLEFSVDYYKINIISAISTLSLQDIVNRCVAGNQNLCALITRTNGAITRIDNPYLNLQSLKTDGLDIEVSYHIPVGAGTASARFLANRTFSYKVSDGVTAVERAGDISNAQPKWTGNATLGFQMSPFNVFADISYIGGGKYDNTFVLPTDINDNSISSRTYVGLQASLDAGEGKHKREIFFNVSNLFNERPPAVFVFSGGPNYERVGRSFRVGFRFVM